VEMKILILLVAWVTSTAGIRPLPLQGLSQYKNSRIYDSLDTNVSPDNSQSLTRSRGNSQHPEEGDQTVRSWTDPGRQQWQQKQKLCRNYLGNEVPCSPGLGLVFPGFPQVPDNSLSVPERQEICLSEGCIGAANMLLKNMNQDADPCEDFYEFTCGGFEDRVVIPDDRASWSQFSEIDQVLTQQLRAIIEDVHPGEARIFTKARNIYQACMNEPKIEEIGMEPLLDKLHKLGGWPVLEGAAWDEEKFSWIDTIYKFRQNGFSTDLLVDFSISTDSKNSSWQVISIDQASLGQAQVYLVKGMADRTVRSYYNYMVNVAVLLGAERSEAEKEMMEALEFEMELARASMPREMRRNATRLYNPMMIRDLSDYAPMIPWLEYINNILTPEILVVKDTERVILNEPGYLQNLTALLPTVKKRTIANYMFFRAASASLGFFTKAARDVQKDYSKELSGTTSDTPRWKECVSLTSGVFSSVIGNLYVKKHFKENAKNAMDQMVKDIRKEMEIILREIKWMDEATRSRAQDKLRTMKEYIGYPDELLQVNLLEELYQGLELGADTHFENGIEIGRWSTKYVWSKMREKVDKTDWKRHDTPAIVNAFYSALENSIQFPAGILQGVFFGSDRPSYMNYGAIGWVIGHEITHGFDDQGRQFDDEGNLANWWEEQTGRNFLSKSRCIIEQYGNYTAKKINIPLNGINTQGENIADNGGIKEAYKAYNSWVVRNGEEPRLPGLQKYTPNQLFWITAGNVWCSKYRDVALEMRIRTGAHSPGPFRVKGPFSNSPDFSRDFKCPSGSVMNPTKKCEVW